eukprot:NODE_14_length_42432_cov_0.433799.p15 type:complete len:260 gc:universal NODE_14_length_42432_cov_0.433799:39189-39968(+)
MSTPEEIIEWHEDGWFKGNICALAVLTFFLSSPGYFDKIGGGRFNAALGILALVAFFIRPVRFIYGGACNEISILYWLVVSALLGVYVIYMGQRINKNKKAFIAAGVTVTITQASKLGGHSATCTNGSLVAEGFETWTMYAGAVLVIVAVWIIAMACKFFKDGKMTGDDVRLKKLDLVSRIALVASPLPLIGAGLASFAGPMKNVISGQLVLLFATVYLASVSHITMFLYDSLSKYMKAAQDGSTVTNVNAQNISMQNK